MTFLESSTTTHEVMQPSPRKIQPPHIVEVELKAEAEQVSNIPQCLEKMKTLVESVLGITKYEQEQSGMEKYM